MRMHHHDTEHWNHKEMDYMGQQLVAGLWTKYYDFQL